ncbi:MAG TPA: hypothetical protein DCZ23_02480 [Lachnospiraceae bacterium]|nr:hypothetical protein [Lachnospiraceae bacterium]
MGENQFDGSVLSMIINMTPDGKSKMEALREYIKQADEAGDNYYRLYWRYEYAYQATFHDDPSKAIPVAAEYNAIVEDNPDTLNALPEDARAEGYLMIVQMGIDPVAYMPQIPMEQWEKMMEQFYILVKRYNTGLRTYWWQMARFWRFIDKEKAHQYFQKFWKTGRDGLSDCRACERSYAVLMSLMAGDREAADRYAKPLKAGRLPFCEDAPKLYIYAYLENALDSGNLDEAQHFANQLNWKIKKTIQDLNYLGAVIRCFAYTNKEKACEKLASGIKNVQGLWDQKKVYDFYKGAWVLFHELAKEKETASLSLPETFQLYKKDGIYNCHSLAEWFYSQAQDIGKRFDKRNGSSYFEKNLELAILKKN